MEHLKEGGARCMKCYELRLEEAAQQAAEGRFDYFTTTLSISPLKKFAEVERDRSDESGKSTA